MVNNVVLVGRLVKDPELKQAGETPVCSFVLAVDRNYKNSEGEREADFLPVVAWRKLGEICAENLSKGRLVAVTGRIQVRNWEDETSQRHYVTEIVAEEVRFLDRPKEA
ncbi:MAG: Single-stranded DNA-binding protein [Firmicutes bacterium]|nr:Single-stranded DNA-binding protein [Bacillota bacterium]